MTWMSCRAHRVFARGTGPSNCSNSVDRRADGTGKSPMTAVRLSCRNRFNRAVFDRQTAAAPQVRPNSLSSSVSGILTRIGRP